MLKGNEYLLSVRSLELEPSRKRRSVLFVCAVQLEFDASKKAFKTLGYSAQDISETLYRVSYKYGFIYVLNMGITYFNIFSLYDTIRDFRIHEVINFGTCAGISGQSIGDIIVSNNCKCWDLDLTPFGYAPNSLETSSTGIGPLMMSGSHFLQKQAEVDLLKKVHPEAVSFDMESFMISVACNHRKVPFIIIRAVSDNGHSDALDSYEHRASESAFLSAMYSILLVERVSVKFYLKTYYIENN